MADTYTDIQEMSRYSRHTLAALEGITALDPLIGRLRTDQNDILLALESMLSQKQSSGSTKSLQQQALSSTSASAKTTLDIFFTTLESAEATGSSFDFKRFFPTRRRSDIGRSVADRLASVRRCLTGLELYASLPSAKEWQEKLAALEAELSQHADAASASSQKNTEDVRAYQTLRLRWQRSYKACKRGVEAVLLLAERESELKSFFLDLQ